MSGSTSKSQQRVCPLGQPQCPWLDELERLQGHLERLSQELRRDGLTGLYNYRYFRETLEQELERSRRLGTPVSLVMADVDHFKDFNDRWGHEAGNAVLVAVADRLRRAVRRIDTVCRYGGEEMAVILPGAPLGLAVQVAERLRAEVAGLEVPFEGQILRVTLSLGVAVFPAKGVEDAETLVQRADEQLYRAKAEGRDRVAHPPLIEAAPESQVTEEEKRALFE